MAWFEKLSGAGKTAIALSAVPDRARYSASHYQSALP